LTNNYKFLKSIYIPGSKDEIELVPTVEGVNDNEESSENTTNMGGSVCGASYKEIAIDANGDVYPCQMLISKQWKLGNIFEGNYPIRQNQPEIIELFKRRNLSTISSCNICEYKYLCGGGCPAISYYLYKDTEVAPSVACDFIKAEIDVKMVRMLKEYEEKF
jgi:radical SAM protein with 4Fe4S-binding SPASM domain